MEERWRRVVVGGPGGGGEEELRPPLGVGREARESSDWLERAKGVAPAAVVDAPPAFVDENDK